MYDMYGKVPYGMVPFLTYLLPMYKKGAPKINAPQTAQDATGIFATARHGTAHGTARHTARQATKRHIQHNTQHTTASHYRMYEHEGIVNVKQKLYQTTRTIFGPVRSVN